MTFRDLRDTVDHLQATGHLLEIQARVSPRHEAAAVLAAEPGRAVRFHRVGDLGIPVVGNVVSSRGVLARALGVEPADVPAALTQRLTRPIEPVRVDDPPVTRVDASFRPLDRVLPILTHYADDSGPFLTTAMISARDPATGAVVRGIHRMELRGDHLLGAALLNPPLADVYAAYRADGKPMPAAVVVGMDPLTFTAFAMKGVPGADKLALAGGLRGEPVEVGRGPHTGLEVPARAEFLLEGVIDPADERDDGPLGEIGGYSATFRATPTFRVETVTHREHPVYHALLPTGPDGDLLLSLTAEAFVAGALETAFPFVRRLHFVPGTFGSSVVVQVESSPRERIRSLLVHLVTLGVIKKAVAVADDVDPSDPAQVEWSLATRFQADRDAVVLGDLRGLPIDPSCPELFRSAKLALDATGGGTARLPRRAVVEPHAARTAARILEKENTP